LHSSILFPLFAVVGSRNGGSGFLPIMGSILALILFGLAFGYVIQLYRYTRGGQSAKAWGLLSGALFLLALRLIFELARQVAIYDVNPKIGVFVTFLAALLLAFGFRHQKRILK
jgi:hypothetical protein